ncbi:MAG: copper oxidase [Rhodospirillales bacterium CG15_BIG_FIL_POST_REV_8_21_14_020_66_15]|nr:MAG: copper oxidase [Rhodospirillales bacterium CG15_BIG_FIL_POST_REV_8_21_14_020_66_15]
MTGLPVTRRRALAGIGAAVGAALVSVALPPLARAKDSLREYRLKATPDTARLVGPDGPETTIWAYNGSTPGPVIRARQGERIRVLFENALAQPSTIHWHGIRLPNAMDGVPFLTQAPVKPGETFAYEFDAQDAGTFWCHPHFNSSEQVAMGLAGALIVDEPAPPAVDRDVLWVIDDWRLTREGAIAPFDRPFHDMFHGGRFGNTVTVNGRIAGDAPVTSGERIRLRLVNVANARIFRLTFTGHRPWLAAIDGHPIPPRRFEEGQLIIAPGSRADLIIDMEGKPGERFSVIDDAPEGIRYSLADLTYGPAAEGPAGERSDPAIWAANPVAEPDLATATRLSLDMEGGAMSGLESALYKGEKLTGRELARNHGMAWSFNGVVHPPMTYGEPSHPMFTFKKGESVVLTVRNKTAFPHPVHLHGHTFRLLARNGKPAPDRPWQDTVLLPVDGEAEIAFVADNPGDWMLHCHILEHQKSGMMGYFKVA